jgi:outer membrane protein assembly factor BamB
MDARENTCSRDGRTRKHLQPGRPHHK